MGSFDLVCFGDLMVDHYFALDALPLPGTKARARFLGAFGGGMAGNVARVAAECGLRSALVASVGDDEMGSRLRSELRLRNVDAHWVIGNDEDTGRTVITLLPDGERTIMLAPGGHVCAALGKAREVLSARPRLIYTSAVEMAGSLALAQASNEASIALVCDIEEHEARQDPAGARALASHAELVACSRATSALLGLRSPGTLRLILAGSEGLTISGDEGEASVPPAPGTVLDTTGGGDAAVAACACGLVGGASLENMASAASASAARVVSRLGVGDRIDV